MPLKVEAIYENGVLKLEQPLPLPDREPVILTVEPTTGHAKRSYGLIAWTGSAQELDELLGAE